MGREKRIFESFNRSLTVASNAPSPTPKRECNSHCSFVPAPTCQPSSMQSTHSLACLSAKKGEQSDPALHRKNLKIIWIPELLPYLGHFCIRLWTTMRRPFERHPTASE